MPRQHIKTRGREEGDERETDDQTDKQDGGERGKAEGEGRGGKAGRDMQRRAAVQSTCKEVVLKPRTEGPKRPKQ